MCGIAGIVGGNPAERDERVRRMVKALHHRGPDASGIMSFKNATLGHTRLAIVDLSGGAQPMASAVNPRVAVTFNGEIYGFRELREQYSDYPFKTSSDTELLLAMYHRDGPAFLEKLPGMFAFGIWDDEKQTLLLARDRFGEKPLYWAPFEEDGARGLIFASEIKAILAAGVLQPKLDRLSLSHYLQYLYVHPTRTIYENVQTIERSQYVVWGNGRIRDDQYYWRLPSTRTDVSPTAAVRELREKFEQAVKRQLVADVPVGAFLSGGLDSSTVVAHAAGLKGGEGLQTFSFRFAGAGGDADESGYSREVAAKYGTRHHVLEDTDAGIAELLHEMANVYDEPFADSSNVATWLISRQARHHLKVVLTGDGGDELLGGYPWYGELLKPGDGSIGERRMKQNQFFSYATLEKFALTAPFAPKRFAGETNTIDDAMRMDLRDYMPGDILVKIDRASMAHGLELRAPFLDVDLASFLISLPAEMKIGAAGDKLIFREAFGHLWPEGVKKRRKQGFGAPVAEWLSRPAVRELVQTRLCERSHPLFDLLPFDATRIAVERQNTQTWILLVLALWLERHKV